jgi:hypothetical protein
VHGSRDADALADASNVAARVFLGCCPDSLDAVCVVQLASDCDGIAGLNTLERFTERQMVVCNFAEMGNFLSGRLFPVAVLFLLSGLLWHATRKWRPRAWKKEGPLMFGNVAGIVGFISASYFWHILPSTFSRLPLLHILCFLSAVFSPILLWITHRTPPQLRLCMSFSFSAQITNKDTLCSITGRRLTLVRCQQSSFAERVCCDDRLDRSIGLCLLFSWGLFLFLTRARTARIATLVWLDLTTTVRT